MITVYFSVATALLLAIAFGSMFFLSFVMAPLVFKHFEKEQAIAFMRKVFPRYYLVTGMCVLVATGLLVVQVVVTGELLLLLSIILGATAVAIFWLLRQNISPMIEDAHNRAEAGEADKKKHFRWLHRASLALNFVQMILIGVMVGQLALWDAPSVTTGGQEVGSSASAEVPMLRHSIG